MKRYCVLLLCLLSLAGFGHAASVVMRCGLGDPLEGNPIGEMMVRFKDKIEKDSNGEIKVELYPSLQLGGQREMLEATRMGDQEVVVCTPAWASSFVPQLSVLSLPYLFDSTATARKLLDGEIGQELSAYSEKAGFKILGYPYSGYRQITNNVRPIRTLEDYAGIKIRLQSDPVHMAAMKELGANPIAMAAAELYSALQQGVIDAQENAITNIFIHRYAEQQKYLSLTKVFFDSWAIFISKPFFDRLSDAHKDIVMAATKETVALQRVHTEKADEESLKKLVNLMQVNEVGEAELARMARKTRVVYGMFNDKIGEELIKKVLAAVE